MFDLVIQPSLLFMLSIITITIGVVMAADELRNDKGHGLGVLAAFVFLSFVGSVCFVMAVLLMVKSVVEVVI